MNSQYMQLKLFLAATDQSRVERRIKTAPRLSMAFWQLFKRHDDLSSEIESIYRKTEVRS